MKKIISRLIYIIPAVAIQILWYMIILDLLRDYIVPISFILSALSVVFVLYIIYKRGESAYKILWIIVILTLPLLGALLYIGFGDKISSMPIKLKLERVKKASGFRFKDCSELFCRLKNEDKRASQSFEYVYKATEFPLVRNSECKYYPLGDDMFPDMCEALESAEKYIFAEYFIIGEGVFWDKISEILVRKAKAGVDVRLIYDDVGCLSTFSKINELKLRENGVECIAFNPLNFLKARLNNRDHRKILVIDGKVVFSGGINLADEYINKNQRFGHWKDIGFRITGESAVSYTYMFAELWNAYSHRKIPPELFKSAGSPAAGDDGYVLSYCDSPFNTDAVSNNLIMDILSQAEDYAWFYTPYLILGENLLDSFVRTAKRGVDVRIIMPGIPDKKLVFRLSRSYYPQLLEAGVKIYEYNPGFVHAKACLCDDKLALLGTVNLDYRSLFLHFECSSLMYKSRIIPELKSDFIQTLSRCTERTTETEKKGIFNRLFSCILRVFAPLI